MKMVTVKDWNIKSGMFDTDFYLDCSQSVYYQDKEIKTQLSKV